MSTPEKPASGPAQALPAPEADILAWLRKEAESEDYFGRKYNATKFDAAANLIESQRAALAARDAQPEPVSYHRDDDGPEAAAAYVRLLARLDDDGRKKLANWIAHDARATLAADGAVILTRKDWTALKIIPPAAPAAPAGLLEVARMRDALQSIRAHVVAQPSALARAIVATCDYGLSAPAAPAATQDVCRYPDCRCPFDHPGGANWCAKGFPQPAPAAAQGQTDADAARYRWLCEKLGQTQLPTLIERIVSGYVADYKPSIDAAIDAAMSAGIGAPTEQQP